MLLSLLIPRKLVTMRESLIKPLMFNFLGRRESCFQFTESQTHPSPPPPTPLPVEALTLVSSVLAGDWG